MNRPPRGPYRPCNCDQLPVACVRYRRFRTGRMHILTSLLALLWATPTKYGAKVHQTIPIGRQDVLYYHYYTSVWDSSTFAELIVVLFCIINPILLLPGKALWVNKNKQNYWQGGGEGIIRRLW